VPTAVCMACGGRFAEVHRAREMMHGLRDAFDYGECGSCGSLQLLDPPSDLARYYPPDYYSLETAPAPGLTTKLLRRARGAAAVRGHLGLVEALTRGGEGLGWPARFRAAGIGQGSSICDVGCGGGELLASLRDHGFRDLVGIDPFVEQTHERDGIRIVKTTAEDFSGQFDLVMVMHAFEHMPDPRRAMAALRGLVKLGGTLLISIPVAGSWAWREYGVDWVGLDAPRHLFVPSADGLERLARDAGLELYEVDYDSGAMQFWRSEQYRDEIPLFDSRSHEVDPAGSPFSDEQIAEWERQAAQLNAAGDGDTAAFLFRAIAK
jgi:SAM-dependent methyltransferase